MSDTSERRHFAALAMQGLLADHKDHHDERKFVVERFESSDKYAPRDWHWVGTRNDPVKGTLNIYEQKRYTETCAQAVARLAVEHADALIAELNKETK